MRRAIIAAFLLVLGSVVLGATILRAPIASAAQSVSSTIVGPLDSNGNVAVHEQGTADVNVKNASLSVAPQAPVTDGGGTLVVGCPGNRQFVQTASALSIHMDSGAEALVLFSADGTAARFPGPAGGGNASIVLALARPVHFTSVTCGGVSGTATIGTVGNSP
jgi:hypothetical protein